jgi:hypothetical protein
LAHEWLAFLSLGWNLFFTVIIHEHFEELTTSMLLPTPLEYYIVSHEVQVEVEATLRLTVSMSWYRVPMWDLQPDIISCRNVVV